MRNINKKTRILNAIFIFLNSLLAVTVIFLLITALFFTGEGSAPEFFGKRILLVKTDAFTVINKNSAIIAASVPASEIKNGNIIIFNNEALGTQIGEIQNVDYSDDVYTFSVMLPNSELVTVGQSEIIGKAEYYSDILGAFITFAISPLGVAVIAIIPCALILLAEIMKIFRKHRSQVEIETIKKQEEIPTYTPPAYHLTKPDSDLSGNPPPVNGLPLFTKPVTRPSSNDISSHFSSKTLSDTINKKKNEQEFIDKNLAQSATVLKNKDAKPLFFDTENSFQQNFQQRAFNTSATSFKQPKTEELAEISEEIDTAVKQYVPKKAVDNKIKSSDSVSSLDKLLQENATDRKYDIDEILKSLEKK